MQTLSLRASRSLRLSGVYGAAVVPVAVAATVLSIAVVEVSHHAIPGRLTPGVVLLVNVAPPLTTGFAFYFALARWAARRGVLAGGVIGHLLRAWPLYVVALWLAVLLAPSLVHGHLQGAGQLLLWPWLACVGGISGDALAAWFDWPPARHPAAVLAVGALAAGVAVLFVARSRHVPSSPMLATIGLPGPRADADRRCDHSYSWLVWHSLPTRRITCRGRRDSPPGAYLSSLPTVAVDAYTRRIAHASRRWEIDDSLSWERTEDSVRVALQRRGGRPVACGARATSALDHIRAKSYWDFRGYMVRVVAYANVPGMPEGRRPRWLVQVDAYPGTSPECERGLRRRGRAFHAHDD